MLYPHRLVVILTLTLVVFAAGPTFAADKSSDMPAAESPSAATAESPSAATANESAGEDEGVDALALIGEGATLAGAAAGGAFLTAGIFAGAQASAVIAQGVGLQYTPFIVLAVGIGVALMMPAATVLVAAALMRVGWLKAVPAAAGAALLAPPAMLLGGTASFLVALIVFLPPPLGGGMVELPDPISEIVPLGIIVGGAATTAAVAAAVGAGIGYTGGAAATFFLDEAAKDE